MCLPSQFSSTPVLAGLHTILAGRSHCADVIARFDAYSSEAKSSNEFTFAAGWRRSSKVVHLTRIYTRTGDGGQTSLGDMSKTSKLDTRLLAYADVDEANSQIGFAIALGGLDADVVDVLRQVQNEMFDVGADLCCPVAKDPAHPPLRIEPDYIRRLERWCDHYNAQLPDLRSFILRGGAPSAAAVHIACTVTRRAERSAWAAIQDHGPTMNVLTAKYLNRLSDLLFVLARYANRDLGDVLWEPGGERST